MKGRERRQTGATPRPALKGTLSCLLLFLLGLLGPVFARAAAGQSRAVDAEQGKKKQGKPSSSKKEDGDKGKKNETAPADDEDDKKGAGFRFSMKRFPLLRFGSVARVEFHTKVQTDFRTFDPEVTTNEGTFDLNRVRVSVSGHVLRHFEYEVEREIRDEFRTIFRDPDEEFTKDNPWRDVYVNFRYFRRFQVKGGKFKIPFGFEQLTGPSKLDFVYRARISDQLTPGRDRGVMLHGKFFDKALSYEAGYFVYDGENARTRENEPTGERAVAVRVTGLPLQFFELAGPLRGLELGGAFVTSSVPGGANGIRGRSVAKYTIFPRQGSRLFVDGRRLRVGTELNWASGPFSIKGEYIHFRDERYGQSIRGTDLPDMISRGWYLTGSWVLTGEKGEGKVEPKRSLIFGRGIGAVELATRYEAIRFGSVDGSRVPSRDQRAFTLLPNSDRAWTFGLNWYWNRWFKVQFNAVRERIEDLQRTPLIGNDLFWTRVWRLQFVM